MATRLCVVSQKGGVGKTTVSLNLAVALARRGRRTLLVDLDPQGGVGHSLARPDTSMRGIADLLVRKATPEQAVLQTRIDRLSLLPRGRLDPVDAPRFEEAIRRFLPSVLDQVEARAQLVVFDTPAGMGSVTRAAMAVSHFAVIPAQAEALSLRTVDQALRVMDHVRSRENPALRFLGILPNMVVDGDDGAPEEAGQLARLFLETSIPRLDVFTRASRHGVPVSFLAGPVSSEARLFERLAAELEHRMEQLPADQQAESPAGPA